MSSQIALLISCLVMEKKHPDPKLGWDLDPDKPGYQLKFLAHLFLDFLTDPCVCCWIRTSGNTPISARLAEHLATGALVLLYDYCWYRPLHFSSIKRKHL